MASFAGLVTIDGLKDLPIRAADENSACCSAQQRCCRREQSSRSLVESATELPPVTNVAFAGELFELSDELSTDDQVHSEESYRRTASSLCTEATLSSPGTDFIGKRLLKYGIVPLERKAIHASTATTSVKLAVEEVRRWLFVEGGHFRSVQSLMTNYCIFVRDILGIPVDRLLYGGLGLHPKLTGLLWKWEPNDFVFREMPEDVFARRFEIFSPHEPFCVLERGLADFVRIKASDKFIPPDTEKWFRGEHYVDYFALPDIHRSEARGSLAWATKDPNGFSDEHISFFEITLPALTTVLRLHANDLVLRTLTERMEREIKERTNELEEANRQLAHANDQLASQSEKQLQHFACMSHEIRTPLNCIVGMASLLLEQPGTMAPEVVESVQMIHSSADLLHAVVDDVLDYSKMESGVFEVDIRPTNLQETLNAVVHAMQEKAAQKSVRIVPTFGPTLPHIIGTDPRRLQQIMYNLLGNACKFSRMGEKVELNVSLESNASSSSQHVLRFAIKDYGKGIHEKDFEAIFRPFDQAGKETQTIYGGTGLGLSITLALVDRLGGRITVDSKVGEFSEFVVEFPSDGKHLDVAGVTEALADTTIVLLTSEEPRDGPFRPEVAKVFALDVVVAKNWDQLEEKMLESSRSWCRERLIIVVPVNGYNRVRFQGIRALIKSCTLITYGRTQAPEDSCIHWQSFHSIFPIVALTQIIDRQRFVEVVKESGGHQTDYKMVTSTIVLDDEATKDRNNTCEMESPRILIAEDNLINQKVLVRVLRNLGIQDVDIVDDGLKAVEACGRKAYSLVFMDLQMPFMDGLQSTKFIKSQVTSNPPKIIFCTAHALEDFRQQVHDVGADGFISKPYNVKKIGSCLQEHLGRH